MEPSDSYQKFWEKLSPAYPISRGEFRLPIATSLFDLPNKRADDLSKNLVEILDLLLKQHGTKKSAAARAYEAGEGRIIPLITDEFTGVVRFDCIIDSTTDEFKILEINCDYPDGLILHDKTYSALQNEDLSLHENLLTELFDKDKAIAILHSKKATFIDGYHAEKIALEKMFKDVEIGSDINYTVPKIIRRCLEVSKLSEADIEQSATLPHKYINTFSLRTLGYKNLLSEIDHSYVPKTVSLNRENLDEFLMEKDKWVIKPIEGCEGNGIYFGRDNDMESWQDILDRVVDIPYIAQEFISISKQKVEFYENDGINERELYFDICPYFFIKDGKIIGNGHTLMRFSENKIVNVTKGGGIGYHRL